MDGLIRRSDAIWDDVYRLKQGKWIFDDPLRADFKCSECLERNDICTNFCPYCGAKMKGVYDD